MAWYAILLYAIRFEQKLLLIEQGLKHFEVEWLKAKCYH